LLARRRGGFALVTGVPGTSKSVTLRILAELRLLSSAKLDSHILLTVVLAGDGRLLEHLRSDELMPLNSRMRVRLALEWSTPDELAELIAHALQKAGAVKLMTPELIATLADHAQGNPRALMNIAGARDEDGEATAMSLLPVEPAWRLAERAEEHRWLVTGLWAEQAVSIVGGEPKCCKSFLALDLAVAVAAGAPCLRRPSAVVRDRAY
jgi:AAA domain